MAKILYYDNFDEAALKNDKNLLRKFDEIIKDLEKDNYTKQGNLKLIVGNGGAKYLRAKLSDSDRLLFTCMKYNGEHAFVILEVILNHNYHKSKFLMNSAKIKSIKISDKNAQKVSQDSNIMEIMDSKKFSFLGKVVFFSSTQEDIIKNVENNELPLVVNGFPGSGKTSVILESLQKLKERSSNQMILYITRSESLVKESKRILEYEYYDEDDKKFKIGTPNTINFLSLEKFLQSLTQGIRGKKVIDRSNFFLWFKTKCQGKKFKCYAKDGEKILEEFTAVIAGGNLKEDDYIKLGARQSIFTERRNDIYSLFQEYKNFMERNLEYYDPNLVALKCAKNEIYDFVIVDEVQDFTVSTLNPILRSLKDGSKDNFLLCGDVNQVIHPSFFSLSRLKSFLKENFAAKEISVFSLEKNYRNSQRVIELANRVLHLKNYCFSPEDKMTGSEKAAFFVKSDTTNIGSVSFIVDDILSQTNKISKKVVESANWAILVLNNEDKKDAKKFFKTPLIFDIYEAKGLEFRNVILYKFTSHASYNELWKIICLSKNEKDIQEFIDKIRESFKKKDISVSRTKNKSDKSFEELKFYINALYVGVTRAINSVYLIDNKSNLLRALEVGKEDNVVIEKEKSSSEEWKNCALQLIGNGNIDQASVILDKLSSSLKDFKEVNNALLLVTNPEIQKNTTDLFDALKEGNLGLALNLVRKAFNINSETVFIDNESWSLLHLAAYHDNIHLLNCFYRAKGSDINVKNSLGMTPLHIAVRYKCEKALKFLITHGADINAAACDGSTSARLALQYRCYDILKYLAKMGALLEPKQGLGSYLICVANFSDLVEFILKNIPKNSKKVEVNYTSKEKESLGMTPLHVSVLCVNYNSVELLLKEKKVYVNIVDNSGSTPLNHAIQSGNIDIVRLLIKKGADINFKDDRGTPLQAAMNLCHDDIIKLLIEKGADINVNYDEWPIVSEDVLDCVLSNPNLNVASLFRSKAVVHDRNKPDELGKVVAMSKLDHLDPQLRNHNLNLNLSSSCRVNVTIVNKPHEVSRRCIQKIVAKNQKDFSLFTKLEKVKSLVEVDDKFLEDLKKLLEPEDVYSFKPGLNYSPDNSDKNTTITIAIKVGGEVLQIIHDYAKEHIGTDTEIFKKLKKAKKLESTNKPKNNLLNPPITCSNLFEDKGCGFVMK